LSVACSNSHLERWQEAQQFVGDQVVDDVFVVAVDGIITARAQRFSM
jgi:peroxiredoxin